jgi:cytoskeletal protein CcmA (bactofilin family)
MFKKTPVNDPTPQPMIERVTSVLGPGINWAGNLGGKGGIRIEGTFEGEISIRGLVVIGETGRLSCQNLRANNVIVAGAVKGNITAEKLEIRSTGRVWGDVVVVAFSTEEGAFLRGQVRMEESIDLHREEKPAEPAPEKPEPDQTTPEKKIRKIAKSE